MKFQVKTNIGPVASLTDFAFLDSNLHNNLDVDPYMTQQYIEATQIITDLHDHLLVNEEEAIDESAAADLCNLISNLADKLRTQLDSYSDNQYFINNSSDRMTAAINIVCDGAEEIDQLFAPVRFDDLEK